jgi:hypothetical protein
MNIQIWKTVRASQTGLVRRSCQSEKPERRKARGGDIAGGGAKKGQAVFGLNVFRRRSLSKNQNQNPEEEAGGGEAVVEVEEVLGEFRMALGGEIFGEFEAIPGEGRKEEGEAGDDVGAEGVGGGVGGKRSFWFTVYGLRLEGWERGMRSAECGV